MTVQTSSHIKTAPTASWADLWRLRRDPLTAVSDLHHRYGDVVRLQFGNRIAHLVNHPDLARYVLRDNNHNYVKRPARMPLPDLVGNGLLVSEGDFWRRRRRLIQPAFHRRRLDGWAETMTAATAERITHWQTAYVDPQRPFDVAAEMMALTLEIVARTLFGHRLPVEDLQTVQAAMPVILRYARRQIRPLGKLRNLPQRGAYQQALHRLDEIIYRLIAHRRRHPSPHADDLLTLLLNAQDADTHEQMTDQQVRDEALTIFLAGHETTANLLAWTWYMLEREPAVRLRLTAELDNALGDRPPTVADIDHLPLTGRVLDELLRLYPPAWMLVRSPVTDDELNGYSLPAGSGVLISPYLLHRHADYWDRPHTFDPDRFRDRTPHPWAYLPFGGGPRLCIGNHFARLEATLIVAMIARTYRLSLCAHPLVTAETAITLRPRHGVWVTATRRP